MESYQEHVEEAFKLWDTRVGDYDEYLDKLVEAYVKAMEGLPVSYNDFISDQVVYLKGNRVYSYTRDQIKWHKEQGHKVIFISGSPDFWFPEWLKSGERTIFGLLFINWMSRENNIQEKSFPCGILNIKLRL